MPNDELYETLLLPADAGGVNAAVDLLRAEHAVVFPTDTVYGVGAMLWSEAAVRARAQYEHFLRTLLDTGTGEIIDPAPKP